MGSTLHDGKVVGETPENQGGVEILIVLLHAFDVVLHRLSLVHGAEIKFGVVLDGLEVHS